MQHHRCGTICVRSPLDQHGRITYLAAGCKAWRCKYCGPKKAEKVKMAIARAVEEKGLKSAAEILGVKAKTLHNRISRGDFRDGEDIRKPMGRVLMSVQTVCSLLEGKHPSQRRRL